MVLNSTITLNLKKYGGEGLIVMGYPTLQKKKKIEQITTEMVASFDSNGRPQVDSSRLVEAELYNQLVYVESAPFGLDVKEFYDFTDALDKNKRGAGIELYKDMVDAISRINEGDLSPSPNSQEAETASLE